MNAPEAWSAVVALLGLSIPLTLALSAVGWPRRPLPASAAALTLSLLFTFGVAAGGAHPQVRFGVRLDAVTCLMLLLVSALGLLVVRYSRTYLEGEPALARYFRSLLLTLSSVTALVVANNLLAVALGWTCASIALHQLLTFYRERTPALIAAHKKFLVSRLADLCFAVALVLVYRGVGSLEMDRIAAWAEAHAGLTPSMQVAAVLVVLAVALRSAQLPFHGWLIQVMEAPTPVSALLHAGVVNIGGFVMIRLAPWMAHAPVAQAILVMVGLVTSVVAALVMTTRVSVKVTLAWSTCAQMGFMLVECGLGLWPVALLHLLAHSLYKAHSFLSAGSAVEEWRLYASGPRAPALTRRQVTVTVLLALGWAALAETAIRRLPFDRGTAAALSIPLLSLMVSLSLVPLVARGGLTLLAALLRAGGVLLLYVGWHVAAVWLMPAPAVPGNAWSFLLVGVTLVALFVVKTSLQLNPYGRFARASYPWLFAGLYLDELCTRVAFRIWPPRRPQPAPVSRSLLLAVPREARA